MIEFYTFEITNTSSRSQWVNPSPSGREWRWPWKQYLNCVFNENNLHMTECLANIFSIVSQWWWLIIGLDNGLVPYRHQAIIQTNDDPVLWYIHESLGHNVLIPNLAEQYPFHSPIIPPTSTIHTTPVVHLSSQVPPLSLPLEWHEPGGCPSLMQLLATRVALATAWVCLYGERWQFGGLSWMTTSKWRNRILRSANNQLLHHTTIIRLCRWSFQRLQFIFRYYFDHYEAQLFTLNLFIWGVMWLSGHWFR